MSIFSVLNWGFVFIVELEVIAILWEAGKPRRNTDAKKHNRMCICSLLSGVEECKRLFSYKLNNAYLPRLFFQCIFIQASMYGLNFCWKLLGLETRDFGRTLPRAASIEFPSKLPRRHPFHCLAFTHAQSLSCVLCFATYLHKCLLLWTFPHTLVFPSLYSWAIFALHRYYYDGSFPLHNNNKSNSDYCYFTYFYFFPNRLQDSWNHNLCSSYLCISLL